MNQLVQWLSMGGYSAYVWSAYGLVTLTLIISFFSVKSKKKRTQQILQHWFKS